MANAPFCSLAGKTALVTGGSRGIGAAIVRELAGAGASVVVGYRTGADEANALADEVGARAVQADVSSPDEAARLVEAAGDLDVLVNNAGLTRDGLLARMSDDDWREVIETNLSSVFYTCRAVARPMMKKRTGAIVNVSSIVGLRGNFGQTNYAASKAGIIGFTKSLARELGSRGVRVNVVAPGYVQTPLSLNSGYRVYLKTTQIGADSPANRFVFGDVNPESICTPGFGVNMVSEVFVHYPSSLHRGSGVLAFSDSHVESHKWLDPRTPRGCPAPARVTWLTTIRRRVTRI